MYIVQTHEVTDEETGLVCSSQIPFQEAPNGRQLNSRKIVFDPEEVLGVLSTSIPECN